MNDFHKKIPMPGMTFQVRIRNKLYSLNRSRANRIVDQALSFSMTTVRLQHINPLESSIHLMLTDQEKKFGDLVQLLHIVQGFADKLRLFIQKE